ncbi:peptide methionine sulfoxide reductase-like [Asparagus officinalis]|uniref:peptide methionine sulfoxide reductase-like n=1 Tax=Asparagus officinalis TaxID=4686 RepID=UPI00098E7B18|nr:peptide methionine sulfoxide reductase-like [Asparagus officinalis]
MGKKKGNLGMLSWAQWRPSTPRQAPSASRPPDARPLLEPNLNLAQFAARLLLGREARRSGGFQGVVKTEVGYSQGHVHDPTYSLVRGGGTGHAEVLRVHFDPSICSYLTLLSLFWGRHDPTALNRQGNDVGTQYRSGIYYYNEEQAKLAKESKEAKEKEMNGKKIVTEILPAKKFYRAEEYHQQYLEKGGGRGLKQSAAKGCNDPIRCYG